MIEVKIECPCGQHYAFDVEPVSGRMPTTIACPACEADGTEAANHSISQQISIPAKLPATRLVMPTEQTAQRTTPGIERDARSLGLVSREQAEAEARAKISWGDEPNEVVRYLMLQSYTAVEAKEFVDLMIVERLGNVRKNGVRQTIIGFGMSFGTGLLFFLFYKVGFTSFIVMGMMGVAIVFGLWRMVGGILMIAAPKMQSGDVAED